MKFLLVSTLLATAGAFSPVTPQIVSLSALIVNFVHAHCLHMRATRPSSSLIFRPLLSLTEGQIISRGRLYCVTHRGLLQNRQRRFCEFILLLPTKIVGSTSCPFLYWASSATSWVPYFAPSRHLSLRGLSEAILTPYYARFSSPFFPHSVPPLPFPLASPMLSLPLLSRPSSPLEPWPSPPRPSPRVRSTSSVTSRLREQVSPTGAPR